MKINQMYIQAFTFIEDSSLIDILMKAVMTFILIESFLKDALSLI